MKYKLFFLIILLIYISNVYSNSLRVRDIADTLYIGQVINIEVDLTEQKPERIFVLRDRSTPQLELFDILSFPDKPWLYLLRVAPFDTGFIQTDRIPIYFTKDSVGDTVYIEPFSFYVRSALTLSDTLIRDIKPPQAFKWKFWDYFLPIIILLAIAAIIYYLLKLKQKIDEREEEYIDTRPAWIIALEMLALFKQKSYLQNGQYLEYYYELSMIFRIFLEKQFFIKAAEMTTYEIKQAIPDIDQKQDIIKILYDMDKIKYAKIAPIIKEAEDILYWVEKYITSFSKEVDNV